MGRASEGVLIGAFGDDDVVGEVGTGLRAEEGGRGEEDNGGGVYGDFRGVCRSCAGVMERRPGETDTGRDEAPLPCCTIVSHVRVGGALTGVLPVGVLIVRCRVVYDELTDVPVLCDDTLSTSTFCIIDCTTEGVLCLRSRPVTCVGKVGERTGSSGSVDGVPVRFLPTKPGIATPPRPKIGCGVVMSLSVRCSNWVGS